MKLSQLLFAAVLLAAATAVFAEESSIEEFDTPEFDEDVDNTEAELDLEVEEEDASSCAAVTTNCKLSSTCQSTQQLAFVCDNYQGKGPYKLTYEIDPKASNIDVQGCSNCKPTEDAGGPIMTGTSSRCTRSGGKCQNYRTTRCTGGRYKSGMCPGSSSIRCCLGGSSGGSTPSSSGTNCGIAGGKCQESSGRCNGSYHSGLCPGKASIKCCIPPKPAVGSSCGDYANSPTEKIAGNSDVVYNVVKVLRKDLTYASYADKKPTEKDNTMTKETACAFARLKAAANKAGHKITINSAFRTIARQRYFWNCYQTKKCNNGNAAARPGTSNHGRGRALDLQLNSSAYTWMRYNAKHYGFVRTVSSETWHWEYRPGSRCNNFVPYRCV